MNNPFKVGDKIRFISNKSAIYNMSETYTEREGLVIGNKYKVIETNPNGRVDPDYIKIEGGKGWNHAYDCFEFVIPDDYAIKVNNREQKDIVAKYLQDILDRTYISFPESANYVRIQLNKQYDRYGASVLRETYEEGPYKVKEILEFEDWKRMIDYNNSIKTNMKEIVGYKLLKDLPDIPQGSILTPLKERFEYTGGTCKQYAYIDDKDGLTSATKYTEFFITDRKDWFEPVYEIDKSEIIDVDYDLGDDSFQVKVSKGKIEVVDVEEEEGSMFKYEDLKKVLDTLKNLKGSKWDLAINYIDIGCKKDVSIASLHEIKQSYETINGIK